MIDRWTSRQIEQTLAGKRGIVTGAGSGIGRAVALRIAAAGGAVAGVDLNLAAAEQGAQEGAAFPGSITPWQCDISSETEVDTLLGQLVAAGFVDYLVNAAGIEGSRDELGAVPISHWDQVMNVNLRGSFLTMRTLIPTMRERKDGAIVNIGSVGSLVGLAGDSAYAASKHAIAGLSKSAVAESARDNVRINVVCPGPIDTPLQDRAEQRSADPAAFRRRLEAAIPQGRFGRPDEVAELVVFLLGDSASYINGTLIPIDGGLTATL